MTSVLAIIVVRNVSVLEGKTMLVGSGSLVKDFEKCWLNWLTTSSTESNICPRSSMIVGHVNLREEDIRDLSKELILEDGVDMQASSWFFNLVIASASALSYIWFMRGRAVKSFNR